MTWNVYILQSDKSKKYYIGSTNNMERRLLEHNNGHTKSTKNKGPWKLIYTEHFGNRLQAIQRELLIKSYKGGRAFKKLLEGIE